MSSEPMPNETVSRAEDTSTTAFAIVGAAAAAYVPFVYGIWLILIPSDGTTKFGGILLITLGVAMCGAVGSVLGAAIGLACSMLGIRDKQKRQQIRVALASIFALAAICTGVSLIVGSVEGSTTRALLITLKSPIDQFQRENHTLPASISDLDPEAFANPFQIDVSKVTIEQEGVWYRLVHVPSGESVRYPLLGEGNDANNNPANQSTQSRDN